MGKTPTPNKLTVKELKLVKGIAQGKKKQQAGFDAGYTGKPETVSATVSETLKKPKVQEALQVALQKHGITLDTAIAPIGKALTAMKQNEFTGEITEDIQTQLKGSDRALKLMGVGQDTNNTTNNFIQVIKEQSNKYA